MPLEIWSHFIHPLTHNGVDGNSQDFSPDDITRVKRIASGSIVLGAVEAYSSSRSVKFSIITIGLATLVIFYIAAAIFKMRIRENPDPKQSDSSNPAPLEPNQSKEQETNLEQQKKEEREDAPIVETSSAQETSPPAALSPQPMIPSGPQASPPNDEKPKESIPSAQGL